MNRFILPSILLGTVLIAGLFAVLPIEKASTVHTTLQTSIGTLQTIVFTDTDWNDAGSEDQIRVTCTNAAVLYGIAFDIAGTLAAGDNIGINIDPDGADGDFSSVTLTTDDFGAVAPSDNANLMAGQGPFGLDTNGFVEVELTAEAADDGNEEVNIAFTLSSTGTCTASDE